MSARPTLVMPDGTRFYVRRRGRFTAKVYPLEGGAWDFQLVDDVVTATPLDLDIEYIAVPVYDTMDEAVSAALRHINRVARRAPR